MILNNYCECSVLDSFVFPLPERGRTKAKGNRQTREMNQKTFWCLKPERNCVNGTIGYQEFGKAKPTYLLITKKGHISQK